MSSFTTCTKPLDGKLADEIFRHTHFTQPEVLILINQYRKITKDEEGMDKSTFFRILQQTFNITEELMMERIFRVFDDNMRGRIEMEEWIQGLSIFLCGTKDERMSFCFKVYDLIGDGCITREVIWTLLANKVNTTGDEDPEEVVKGLTDQIMKMMDHDQDGHISSADYMKSVEEEPLLLQAFGPCLPDDKVRMAVLATFKKSLPKWR